MSYPVQPIDGSPPGFPVPGILQARTLEWIAISSSNTGKWKVKVKSLGRVRLLVTPQTAAYQAPPSMGFSRQEYWSGVPLPSPLLYYTFIKKMHDKSFDLKHTIYLIWYIFLNFIMRKSAKISFKKYLKCIFLLQI